MKDAANLQELRLDKWLWAARFFKTRQLAIEAINGGKVHLDGQRVKPSRSVRPGNQVEVHKESLSWTVEVLAIDKQRRSASEAAKLYVEDENSRLKREKLVRERRDLALGQQDSGGRPSKRDRRMIQRFTGRGESDA